KLLVVRPPEVHAALVAAELVRLDPVLVSVLDVDAAALEAVTHLAVARELVEVDQGLLGIAAPDAADGILDEQVLEEPVPEAERHLEPMGGGVGQVVVHEDVVVAPAALVIETLGRG